MISQPSIGILPYSKEAAFDGIRISWPGKGASKPWYQEACGFSSNLAMALRRKNTALKTEMLKFEHLIQRVDPFEALGVSGGGLHPSN
jgi:hypothetical protein